MSVSVPIFPTRLEWIIVQNCSGCPGITVCARPSPYTKPIECIHPRSLTNVTAHLLSPPMSTGNGGFDVFPFLFLLFILIIIFKCAVLAAMFCVRCPRRRPQCSEPILRSYRRGKEHVMLELGSPMAIRDNDEDGANKEIIDQELKVTLEGNEKEC
ncbi:hypothetical protein niasHT_036871 [Heterodera trifolii]|uniref:Uncharacterized protein n=2 Tax=Heterodera trifolii TaxID=157864 RepID=A0ABD2IGP9_9BILA